MKSRRQSREFILQILFLKEFSSDKPLAELVETFSESFAVDPEVAKYGLNVLTGLESCSSDVDALIEKHSRNWRVPRMGLVDRSILRMTTYEMLFLTPPLAPAVAINEAVELAKEYGSEDSPGFINGILDSLRKVQ